MHVNINDKAIEVCTLTCCHTVMVSTYPLLYFDLDFCHPVNPAVKIFGAAHS